VEGNDQCLFALQSPGGELQLTIECCHLILLLRKVAKRYWKGQLFDLGAYDTEELAAEAFEKLDEEATDVTDPDTVAEIAERIEQESYEEEEDDDDDDDDDDEEEEEDDE